MKLYHGVYVRDGRVVARIPMYTDDSMPSEEAVKHFEKARNAKVGQYNKSFDVTLDCVELVDSVEAVVIELEVV